MKIPKVHNYSPIVSKSQRKRNSDPLPRIISEILYERGSQKNVYYLDRNAALFAPTPYQSNVIVEKALTVVLKSFGINKMPEKKVACHFLRP